MITPIHLTHDDQRLIVTDYFLDQGDFGKIHFDGDHMVRVLLVSDDGLEVDSKWVPIDFDTAFATGPARPHGVGMK